VTHFKILVCGVLTVYGLLYWSKETS